MAVNGEEKQGTLDSDQIISDAYRSLDRQIDKLDLIPQEANRKADALITFLYTQDIDIFLDLTSQLKFITLLRDLSTEVGQAFDTILEIEREKIRPEPHQMPMPQLPTQPLERQSPQVIVQGQQQKRGVTDWIPDYMAVRSWGKTMDKIVALQQSQMGPQITTKKVMDILDYGRELLGSYNETLDFYTRGIDHLYFFNDKETHERQHKQLAIHLVKIANIICTFSRTIAEYRKERFGDRKVSVASGAMWLEAAKAGTQGRVLPF